jgi:hypothetical protein
MIDLNQSFKELELLEEKLLVINETNTIGSYEHWNILNTINHAFCWKNSAIKKVDLRLSGKISNFHSDEPLESINKHFYEQTKQYTEKDTLETMHETLKHVNSICEKIKGKELSNEYVPYGYNNNVHNYLMYDLLYHPITHYIYYTIKNNEYEAFSSIENYLNMHISILDFGMFSFKGMMENDDGKNMFIKESKWDTSKLYQNIKSNNSSLFP